MANCYFKLWSNHVTMMDGIKDHLLTLIGQRNDQHIFKPDHTGWIALL